MCVCVVSILCYFFLLLFFIIIFFSHKMRNGNKNHIKKLNVIISQFVMVTKSLTHSLSVFPYNNYRGTLQQNIHL